VTKANVSHPKAPSAPGQPPRPKLPPKQTGAAGAKKKFPFAQKKSAGTKAVFTG
jgi:hypothetical protein